MQTSTAQFVTKVELKRVVRSLEQRIKRKTQDDKESTNRITRALNQDLTKTADRLERKIDDAHVSLINHIASEVDSVRLNLTKVISVEIGSAESRIGARFDSFENKINARVDGAVESILNGIGEMLGKPKKDPEANTA
jgi:ElaB/YqjD/DUF883 family membrane-anchored ribosome-binding protein